jgi:hypothetical protein
MCNILGKKIKLFSALKSVLITLKIFCIEFWIRVARFFDIIYQNGAKSTKRQLNYQKAMYVIYKMAIIYSKWPQNIPIFFISRPSKIYTNLDFRFENKPSGNPVLDLDEKLKYTTKTFKIDFT